MKPSLTRISRKPLLALSLFAATALYAQHSPSAVLEIKVQEPVAKVSPTLYGLMTEEINYSYDGGLYAELVRNRTLHYADHPAHWFAVQNGNSVAAIEVDKSTGPSQALTRSLKLSVKAADAASPAGVGNEGFWGIPSYPSTTYNGSFYAKADSSAIGPITVSLMSADTGKAIATATVPGVSTEWKQYSFQLSTGAVSRTTENYLLLSVQHPGTVWFDQVSLFPPTYKDRANGNRIDLMEKMAAMKPTFLRFPGGNYLEGDHINERYEWKKTIGSLVDRPTHPSPWRYHSSDGLGLLEFLEWCEDLHMQPVLAVYAGYSMWQEHINPGPDLEPYIQDALDEIEYVTGDVHTKWGAVRAKNGHPAPFPLTYVEIGNEDFFDKSGSYDGRYAQFYKAIKARYPQLQLIATTKVKGITPDVIDDHYYNSAQQFFDDVHHYDKTDRKGPKIFVGEWATREGAPTPNFGAALGDAAWMTGMERNSDIVIMASYAPLFVNVNPGGMQWETDLIGYDAIQSYGSPSYYAQVMFGNHVGTEVVQSKLDGAGSRFFYSVTRDTAKGLLILKAVNASSEPQPMDLKLIGAATVGDQASLISLKGNSTRETNTMTEPEKIVPVQSVISGVSNNLQYTFPPYSIQILEFKVK